MRECKLDLSWAVKGLASARILKSCEVAGVEARAVTPAIRSRSSVKPFIETLQEPSVEKSKVIPK